MSLEVSATQLDALSSSLLNKSGDIPLAKRFRALFTLKALATGNDEAIKIIAKGTLVLYHHGWY